MMVKKLKTLSAKHASGATMDNQFAKAVRDSAQQIWLAGLGAFQKAQDEGGKAFDKLVKEGSALQKLTRDFTESKVAEVAGKVAKVQDKVSKQASGTWDKLETVFESRVERALASLGVPTQQDIAALSKRVEHLTAAVDRLAGGKPAAAKKAPAKKAAARPAAKKVAKKAAA